MPLWGDRHIALFANHGLRNQLLDDNLPALARLAPCVYRIYTLYDDVEAIESAPLFGVLKNLMPVQFHFLDHVPDVLNGIFDPAINRMIVANQQAVSDTAQGDALVFLTADCIMSDNALGNAAEHILDGKRAVMITGPRVTWESFEPVLGTLNPSPPALVAAISRHLHHVEKCSFMDSPTHNNYWPNHISHRFPTGWVVHNFHWHPLMVNPPNRFIIPERTIDNQWLSLLMQNIDDYHLVQDSDELTVCSLTPREHFRGTPMYEFPPGGPDAEKLKIWIKHFTDPMHKIFSTIPTIFHSEDLKCE